MSSYISPATRQHVASRANNVCEYCLIAEGDSYFRHQVEHIISLKHGGSSDLENLALSCVFCNRNKGSDVAAIIPNTQKAVRFYNPRTDRWPENFRIDGVTIMALTESAEATIRILQMNHNDQLVSGRWSVVGGQWPVAGGRWSGIVVGRQRSVNLHSKQ